MSRQGITRRQLLRSAAAVGLGAATFGRLASAQEANAKPKAKAPWAEEPKGTYAPFRMAIQSYSLRQLEFQKAIDAAYDLGLEYAELWPGHLPMDLDEGELRRRIKAMRQNTLRRIAYGVVELTADHEKNRRVFEFARRLNLYAITASPTPDSLDSVERLVEEHQVAVAIHNHGPEDTRYGKPELIEKAMASRHELIGACIDTGHFLRAGVKPAEVAKAFKGRVFAVHLKDVKAAGGTAKDVVLGDGDLDLPAFLRALKGAGFKGGLALEYEEEPADPVPSIKKCLQAVAEAVKAL